MRRSLIGGMCTCALLLALTGPAWGQVFTPTYASPRLINDIGIYVSDGPGDLAVEGIWRQGLLGMRLGYIDHADGLASLGLELRTPIPLRDVPVGLAFAAGIHGVAGAESAIGIQAGVVGGYTVIQPGMALTPYLHPRLAALNEIGEDDVRLRALADLGIDLEFWNGLVFRFGVALGDVGANWGFGAAIRR